MKKPGKSVKTVAPPKPAVVPPWANALSTAISASLERLTQLEPVPPLLRSVQQRVDRALSQLFRHRVSIASYQIGPPKSPYQTTWAASEPNKTSEVVTLSEADRERMLTDLVNRVQTLQALGQVAVLEYTQEYGRMHLVAYEKVPAEGR